MSFSGWLDPKVLVAIYAAILSTINLCMNLLNKKRILKTRLTIKQEIHCPVQPAIDYAEQYPILHVEIVNKSKVNIFISSVILIFPKGKETFNDNSRRITFPRELKYGETLDCSFNLSSFEQKYKGNKKSFDVYACVKDSLGKEFKSQKIRTKVLLEELELAHSGTKKLEEKFLKDKNDFMKNLSKGFS